MIDSSNITLNDGGVLSYKDHKGEGIPIVLIHGFPLNQKIWQKQVAALQEAGRRVITYDMRGFGESSDPTADYSHEEDLKGLLEELAIQECQLVGMSFGGEVATSFAIDNPDVVTELTLLGAGINGYKAKEHVPFVKWSDMVHQEGGLDKVKKELLTFGELNNMKENNPALYAEIEQIVNEYKGYMLRGDQRKLPDPPTITRLGEVQCPTNVVIGLEDSRDSLEQARELATEIPNCKLEVLEGAGHFINLELPEVTNELILRSGIKAEREPISIKDEVGSGIKMV